MSAADERVEEIRARLAAATPGPWFWRNTNEPILQGAKTFVVMAFRRMGMNGAQPLFRRNTKEAGLLDDAGRENLNEYPDAVLIANAPADLAFLLAEREDWRERAGGEAQRADEASERADQAEAERTELLRRVEQAERAGAVKALRVEASRAARAGNVWAAEWNDDAADNHENGTQA